MGSLKHRWRRRRGLPPEWAPPLFPSTGFSQRNSTRRTMNNVNFIFVNVVCGCLLLVVAVCLFLNGFNWSLKEICLVEMYVGGWFSCQKTNWLASIGGFRLIFRGETPPLPRVKRQRTLQIQPGPRTPENPSENEAEKLTDWGQPIATAEKQLKLFGEYTQKGYTDEREFWIWSHLEI